MPETARGRATAASRATARRTKMAERTDFGGLLAMVQLAKFEIAAADLVVAMEETLLGGFIARAMNRNSAAAVATSVPTQPSKIALISVSGALTPRGSWFGSSLSGISAQVTRASNDPDVAGIVLDVDSQGGTVNGTAEAAVVV